ncbi:MAG: hypothetical protein AB1476_04490 [Candidatus Hadarchaeota archaeon]
MQEFKNGKLATREVDSYGSGILAVEVNRFKSFTVVIRSLNGFSGDVSIGVSGMPNAATYSYPARLRVTTGGQALSVISINTTSSTRAGSYTITVTGTHDGVARSGSAAIDVCEELREAADYTYVMGPMHDGGPSAKPGTMTSAYVVPVNKPAITINGVTIPNYQNETMLKQEVEKTKGPDTRRIGEVFNRTLNSVIGKVKPLAEKIVEGVKTVVNTVKNAVSSAPTTAKPSSSAGNTQTAKAAVNVAITFLKALNLIRE